MDTESFFGTTNMLVVVIKALVTYWYVVGLLRLAGKRVIMSMTSFDYVSTIAMATIIGSTIVSPSITLIEGLTAITALIGVQWIVGSLSARYAGFRDTVTSSPTVLFQRGQFISENMKSERLSEDQLIQKVRAAGFASTDSIQTIIIESAGTISIIDKSGNDVELLPNA